MTAEFEVMPVCSMQPVRGCFFFNDTDIKISTRCCEKEVSKFSEPELFSVICGLINEEDLGFIQHLVRSEYKGIYRFWWDENRKAVWFDFEPVKDEEKWKSAKLFHAKIYHGTLNRVSGMDADYYQVY